MINLKKKEFLRRVKDHKPGLVFMECSTPSIGVDLKYMDAIKKNTGAVTVLGGSHATILAESILRENEFIDYILKNEYDFTLSELVAGLENPAPRWMQGIKGLCWRDNKEIISSGQRPYAKSVALSPPACGNALP